MMNKIDFEKKMIDYIYSSPENFIKKENTLRADLEGMRIFDEPLIGYASAGDTFFTEAKSPEVIGGHFMAPEDWLPEAKTVIAVFLPFTEQVRLANRQDLSWPAEEWLHARIEGQAFQNKICRFVEELLKKEGFAALAPMIDSRFSNANPFTKDKADQKYYTSNWSERHAAYVAGLGTFGLSKGLISRKGVAGRYLSIITSAYFDSSERPYKGVYDYCSNCGVCARNCPVGAISLANGKTHQPCSTFLDSTKAKHAPYYGCGKCQVKVPCEDKAPNEPLIKKHIIS
jgi:epoxyqueuosine reductase QueG